MCGVYIWKMYIQRVWHRTGAGEEVDNTADRKGTRGLQNERRHKAIGQKSQSFTEMSKLTNLKSAVTCLPLKLYKSTTTLSNV